MAKVDNSVTPHVGVWIETKSYSFSTSFPLVTPHVGVWIETFWYIGINVYLWSLPMWECGLKLVHKST